MWDRLLYPVPSQQYMHRAVTKTLPCEVTIGRLQPNPFSFKNTTKSFHICCFLLIGPMRGSGHTISFWEFIKRQMQTQPQQRYLLVSPSAVHGTAKICLWYKLLELNETCTYTHTHTHTCTCTTHIRVHAHTLSRPCRKSIYATFTKHMHLPKSAMTSPTANIRGQS